MHDSLRDDSSSRDVAVERSLASVPPPDVVGPPDQALSRGAPAYLRAVRGLSERVLVPLVGTTVVALTASAPLEGSVLAFLAFVCTGFVVPGRPPWAALLPFMRGPVQLLSTLAGIATLAAIDAVTDLPGLSLGALAILLLAGSLAALLPYASLRRAWSAQPQVRMGVIGSGRTATNLARELQLAGIPDYVVVGRIAVDDSSDDNSEVATLGELGELVHVVEGHDLHLLVMTSEAPRFEVFEEISRSCLHLGVRLWELSGFYEDVFGHVAVAEINAAWFQYIVHPKYRAVTPASKRAIDLSVGFLLGLVLLPLLALSALLLRRDGGPVLFKQVRIGEGGRPVTIYKLRTMTPEASASAQWADADDPRVTSLGRLLRRTHLDELPQLLNVLRGEMTLVGPRPEQPEFVERLEEALPFYQRRHLMKPGITGWAQVRCGYAGSDVGSAWKLAHDLYYLKHRSLGFDLAILGETARALVADRRYGIETKWVSFIHGYEPLPPPDRLAAAGSDR